MYWRCLSIVVANNQITADAANRTFWISCALKWIVLPPPPPAGHTCEPIDDFDSIRNGGKAGKWPSRETWHKSSKIHTHTETKRWERERESLAAAPAETWLESSITVVVAVLESKWKEREQRRRRRLPCISPYLETHVRRPQIERPSLINLLDKLV